MKITWDGYLPIRRYAIFNSNLTGKYAIVVTKDDIKTAEKWGNFVSWLGPIRPAEKRIIKSQRE